MNLISIFWALLIIANIHLANVISASTSEFVFITNMILAGGTLVGVFLTRNFKD